MRHIMVAIDRSANAERALDFAVDLAKAIGAPLSIVTIDSDHSGDELLARAQGNIGDTLDSVSAQVLADAERRARYLGASDIRVLTGWGDAATTITEIAKRETVDAIVIGRRGRGQLAGLLLGSVSQKLVSLAPCVVIVVP